MTVILSGRPWKAELNPTSRQKPSHINCTNTSRDFGPVGTKLSRTHAAILVPDLQLLCYFYNLYHLLVPNHFTKGIYMLSNMARMADCSPKTLVHPFSVYRCCQEADAQPKITFLSPRASKWYHVNGSYQAD